MGRRKGRVMTEQPCAGGIVFDDAGRLLLIRRGRPPALGCWSVPGGRCRAGEAPEAACVREVAEETGLEVEVVRWAGRVRRDAPGPPDGDGGVYVIDDFVCRVLGGTLRAGDDASDARWVDADRFAASPLSPGLAEALGEWGLLPR